MRFTFLFIFYAISTTFCNAQKLTFHCVEQSKKSEYPGDSIFIQTCFLNDFKFVTTLYPDYAGRYTYSEHTVFALKNQIYSETTNANVFNEKQSKLVNIINKKIQEDFKKFSTDNNTKDCFDGIDSIPTYTMNDFEIFFTGNEISFAVNWGLPSACRNVSVTSIYFKINKIKKYLK